MNALSISDKLRPVAAAVRFLNIRQRQRIPRTEGTASKAAMSPIMASGVRDMMTGVGLVAGERWGGLVRDASPLAPRRDVATITA